MKLISWNVNGIRACVRNGFDDFLKKTKPDILGLQEIKIDHESRLKADFSFKGYEETWNPAKRPGYSGTAILSKMKPRSIQEGIGISEFDDEGRVQTFEMPKFYFINTYFPNSQPTLARLDYKSRFNKALLAYIKKLEKKKPVIDTFRELNGDKVQYSWWTYRFGARSRNVGWRIDYFLVSAKISKHVKKAFILDSIMGSDHCPVGIEIDI